MAGKMAWLNWSEKEGAWVLRIWDAGWRYDSTWSVDYQGEDEDGNTIDLVDDSLLVRMAELQDDGYRTKVTLNGDYRQNEADEQEV